MPSKAIASLDAWLARAEEVLAEQREHAISPSLGLLECGGHHEWTTTLADLSGGLGQLLDSLCRRPGRWILIIESSERPHLFWQMIGFEDSSAVSEVVSNYYLNGDDQWSGEQEGRLVALGWEPPNPPRRTNFIHVEATTSPDTELVCQLALATMRELFGLVDDDEVFLCDSRRYSGLSRVPGSPLVGAVPIDEAVQNHRTKRLLTCGQRTGIGPASVVISRVVSHNPIRRIVTGRRDAGAGRTRRD